MLDPLAHCLLPRQRYPLSHLFPPKRYVYDGSSDPWGLNKKSLKNVLLQEPLVRLQRLRIKYKEAVTFQQLPRKHRSEEHTSELQSRGQLVCRLLLEKKKK